MKKTIIIALAIAVILAIAIVPMANIMLDEKDPYISDDDLGTLSISKGLSGSSVGGVYTGGDASESGVHHSERPHSLDVKLGGNGNGNWEQFNMFGALGGTFDLVKDDNLHKGGVYDISFDEDTGLFTVTIRPYNDVEIKDLDISISNKIGNSGSGDNPITSHAPGHMQTNEGLLTLDPVDGSGYAYTYTFSADWVDVSKDVYIYLRVHLGTYHGADPAEPTSGEFTVKIIGPSGSGSERTQTITAGAGAINLSLPVGTYQIIEVEPEWTPTYFVNGVAQKAVGGFITVTVEKDDTTRVEIKNMPSNYEPADADFEIQKYVNGSTDFASTESFLFEVYDEDDKLLDSAQTDGNGIAKFTIKAEDLENGKIFKVYEKSSNALYKFGDKNPDGFILVVAVFGDDFEYTIESVDRTVGLTFYNEEVEEDEVFEGSFSIPKVVYDASGKIIDDATVFTFFFEGVNGDIYSADSVNGVVSFSFSTADDFVTGVYYLYEENNAAYINKTGKMRVEAYISNDVIKFVFANSNPRYVNELISEGGFEIPKVVYDANGKEIQVADEFAFVLTNGVDTYNAVTSGGKVSFSFSTADGFKPGTYYLSEVNNPGYINKTGELRVVAYISGDQIKFVFANAIPKYVNELIAWGGFEITKVVVDENGNVVQVSDTFYFVLEDENGKEVARFYTTDDVVKFWFNTGEGGFEPGTYYLYEELTDAQADVYINKTGKLKVVAAVNGNKLMFVFGNAVPKYFNELISEEVVATGGFCILKMIENCAEEYELGDDFTFVVKDEDGNIVATGTTVDGAVTFEFSTKDGFKAGTYYVYEVLTPEQAAIYVTPTSFITVVATIVGNSIIFEFTDGSDGVFYNDLLRGKLIISKTVEDEFIDYLDLPADKTFKVRVFGPNFGTYGKVFDVPMNGSLKLDVILGVYYIEEVESGWMVEFVVDGVSKSGSFVMINVKAYETYEIEIINTIDLTPLKIKKAVVDVAGNDRSVPNGLKFVLKDAAGNVIKEAYTLNEFADFGLFGPDNLDEGIYYIYEEMTPAERALYKFASGDFLTVEATIVDGRLIFEFIDDSDGIFVNELIAKGGFTFEKVVVDSKGNVVDDATVFNFVMKDADGNTVATSSVVGNGIVTFGTFSTADGFKAGTYYIYEELTGAQAADYEDLTVKLTVVAKIVGDEIKFVFPNAVVKYFNEIIDEGFSFDIIKVVKDVDGKVIEGMFVEGLKFVMKDADGKFVAEAYTDAYGVATFTFPSVRDFVQGVYFIYEELTDAQKELYIDLTKTFSVLIMIEGKEVTVQYTTCDTKKYFNELVITGGFKFPKVIVDADGNVVDDVSETFKFVVEDADGNIVATSYTVDGIVEFAFSTAKGFKAGTYYVYEVFEGDQAENYKNLTGKMTVVAKFIDNKIVFAFAHVNVKYVNELIDEGFEFEIIKVVKDANGNVIEGMFVEGLKFVMYDVDGNYVAEAYTDANGVATFTFPSVRDFKQGVYFIHEELTDAQKELYIDLTKTFSVLIMIEGKEVTVQYTTCDTRRYFNELIAKGGFEFPKVIVDADGNVMDITETFKFVVEDADGNIVATSYTVDGIVKFEFSTKNGFKAGTYYVYEVFEGDQADVYKNLTGTMTVVAKIVGDKIIFAFANANVKYVNEIGGFEIRIVKVVKDANGDVIEGMHVEGLKFVMKDADGKFVAEAYTDADGVATFKFSSIRDFESGVYFIYEELTDAEKEIYIDLTETFSVLIMIEGRDVTIQYTTCGKGQYFNELIAKGGFSFPKVVVDIDGVVIDDVTDTFNFVMKDADGKVVATSSTVDGVVSFGIFSTKDGFKAGTYYVYEELTDDQAKVYTDLTKKLTVVAKIVGDKIIFAFANANVKYVNEFDDGWKLIITKTVVDANGDEIPSMLLTGIKFILKDINGNVIKEAYSVDGVVTFEFATTKGFAPGVYFIYEDLTDSEKEIYIDLTGAASVLINIVGREVEIDYTECEYGYINELIAKGGFSFPKVVVDLKGNVVDSSETFNFVMEGVNGDKYYADSVDGIVTFGIFSTADGFKAGTYYIYEELTDAQGKVYRDLTGKLTVVAKVVGDKILFAFPNANVKYVNEVGAEGGFKIFKVVVDGNGAVIEGMLLDGIKFVMYDADGNFVAEEYSVGGVVSFWFTTMDGFEAGVYFICEELTAEQKEIYIDMTGEFAVIAFIEGKDIIFEYTTCGKGNYFNELIATGDFEFPKVVVDIYGEIVEDVTETFRFDMYDADGNFVATSYTDSDGMVYFGPFSTAEDFKAGTYYVYEVLTPEQAADYKDITKKITVTAKIVGDKIEFLISSFNAKYINEEIEAVGGFELYKWVVDYYGAVIDDMLLDGIKFVMYDADGNYVAEAYSVGGVVSFGPFSTKDGFTAGVYFVYEELTNAEKEIYIDMTKEFSVVASIVGKEIIFEYTTCGKGNYFNELIAKGGFDLLKRVVDANGAVIEDMLVDGLKFVMYDADGNYVAEAYSDGGVVSFGPFSTKDGFVPGVYFVCEELDADQAKIYIDMTGEFAVIATIVGDEIQFEYTTCGKGNYFNELIATGEFSFPKVVVDANGDAFETSETFKFVMEDADGNIVATSYTDADGVVSFGVFSTKDDFKAGLYYVYEVFVDDQGDRYINKTGTMTVAAKIVGDKIFFLFTSINVKYVNEVIAIGEFDFQKKVMDITGLERDYTDEFKFVMKDAAGNIIDEAVTVGGKVSFGAFSTKNGFKAGEYFIYEVLTDEQAKIYKDASGEIKVIATIVGDKIVFILPLVGVAINEEIVDARGEFQFVKETEDCHGLYVRADGFKFVMKDAAGNIIAVSESDTINGEVGVVYFGEFSTKAGFKAGTYYIYEELTAEQAETFIDTGRITVIATIVDDKIVFEFVDFDGVYQNDLATAHLIISKFISDEFAADLPDDLTFTITVYSPFAGTFGKSFQIGVNETIDVYVFPGMCVIIESASGWIPTYTVNGENTNTFKTVANGVYEVVITNEPGIIGPR